MTDQNQAAATEQTAAAAPAAAAPRADIIRGRMPVAIVALVRFGNKKAEATKTLATMFGTTVGKIDDIKKNRNFAYVGADFKPTQEQKQQGIDWLKTHPDYDKAGVDALVTELDSIPAATAEEAAAFETARVAARGQTPVTKEGEPANAGGGNRRKPRASKEPKVEGSTEAAAQPTGDALLA